MNPIQRYYNWLHGRWPAGRVEPLPEVRPDGTTAVPGVRVVGDLTGVPLLKFAADSGARAAQAIAAEPAFQPTQDPDQLDVAIIGGGVSGIAAAIEAGRVGLRAQVFEASEPFSTLVNFPKGKPIYTYPTDMEPAGGVRLEADVKEALIDELESQRQAAGVGTMRARVERVERSGGALLVHHPGGPTRAQRAIVAIGRSGDHRRLGVHGESLDKVYNRLHDPADHRGRFCLIVGGGDSALEAAIAIAEAGGHATVSYRQAAFTRPRPENVARLQALTRRPPGGGIAPVRLLMGSTVQEIHEGEVTLIEADGSEVHIDNDVVFVMLGREAPLDFFRRSGIPIAGEWRAPQLAAFAAFFALCLFIYNWKAGGALNAVFRENAWFPYNVPSWVQSWSAAAADPSTLIGTLALTLEEPGFYYSLAYTVAVVLFGIRRIRRRDTPYVRLQTLSLMGFQVLPLFLLPYLILPLMGHNGLFDGGLAGLAADNLFPTVESGHGREYWRAFGFVLAWPLFIWNFFTSEPMWWWLGIGAAQTFVLIPLLVRRWGKGAYCGWICSCGALAETLGDTHRHKMPHGPGWNRLNMVGQAALVWVAALMGLRVWGWLDPGSWAAANFWGPLSSWSLLGLPVNYYYVVDVFLAGAVGVGFYFWFSGRVWCRFACPLAALMHIYARASRFRIFAEKKKCISCNVCTSVCHQGIDVMGFANKGLPMEDPECVRCSACVQSCPTGALRFGSLGDDGSPRFDALPASSLLAREEQARR